MIANVFVRAAQRISRDRRGVAAVEFAMVSVVFLTFIVAVVDIGGAIQQRLVLQQAARAAGQYAISFPTQTDGITKAVGKALPADWTNVTVAPPTACFCAQANSCGSVCASGKGGYIVLQLERPYAPYLFSAIGNCSDGTSSNCVTYVVRFQ